ncbi:MAG: sigma 54-interacting transcriptional regulator [Myxococcales bacterium]|nr:sigma 54-interacting transcriptional regulator [Myxococcales bacterium]
MKPPSVDEHDGGTLKSFPIPKPSQVRLLVVAENTFETYPVPVTGELTIGRSGQVDIAINHPSVSRRHAQLRFSEGRIEVTDLGSANGTKLRDQLLQPDQPVEVHPGDVIELPGATVILQAWDKSVQRQRRLWSHGYFEARLADECERARQSRGTVSLARIHFEHGRPQAVQEVLVSSLRSLDVLASYGPGEYEILFLDTPRKQVESLLGNIARALEKLGAKVKLGAAFLPEDGRDPDSLVAKACAAVQGSPEESASKIVVEDPAMVRLYRLVDQVAANDISVLLLGETGVGKEIIASRLHQKSRRAEKPLLRLNCAALPEPLLESELFGHERGAFTGAVQTKPGLVESADGGTVFLDEVGEMPMSIQAKLLRVLEERRVLRLGGLKEKQIDVRFLAATNRDLEADTSRGQFRADLYYRLNGISIEIPPLRERPAEIEGLAKLFIAEACKRFGREEELELSGAARHVLLTYPWPGNIRELRNVMERAVLLCAGGTIDLAHLPVDKMAATTAPSAMKSPKWKEAATGETPDAITVADAPAVGLPGRPLSPELEDERRRIADALEKCAGNQTQAAKLLGMSRRTLVYKLGTLDLPRPRKPRP